MNSNLNGQLPNVVMVTELNTATLNKENKILFLDIQPCVICKCSIQ